MAAGKKMPFKLIGLQTLRVKETDRIDALVNELKILAEKMNIDIFEVIRAAATKPFGYMPFYPGPGLGGHCIPIENLFLFHQVLQWSQKYLYRIYFLFPD